MFAAAALGLYTRPAHTEHPLSWRSQGIYNSQFAQAQHTHTHTLTQREQRGRGTVLEDRAMLQLEFLIKASHVTAAHLPNVASSCSAF